MGVVLSKGLGVCSSLQCSFLMLVGFPSFIRLLFHHDLRFESQKNAYNRSTDDEVPASLTVYAEDDIQQQEVESPNLPQKAKSAAKSVDNNEPQETLSS